MKLIKREQTCQRFVWVFYEFIQKYKKSLQISRKRDIILKQKYTRFPIAGAFRIRAIVNAGWFCRVPAAIQ